MSPPSTATRCKLEHHSSSFSFPVSFHPLPLFSAMGELECPLCPYLLKLPETMSRNKEHRPNLPPTLVFVKQNCQRAQPNSFIYFHLWLPQTTMAGLSSFGRDNASPQDLKYMTIYRTSVPAFAFRDFIPSHSFKNHVLASIIIG